MPITKLSVVLPVRNCEREIAARIQRVINALAGLCSQECEILAVDDGSKDKTVGMIEELQVFYRQVRLVKHDRPRGFEAAGQTGLERSTSEVVLIQETNNAISIDDLHHLIRMASDESIVAARCESSPQSVSMSLMRRLRAWGTDADEQVMVCHDGSETTAMQLVRRSNLQRLAAPGGEHYRLHASTDRLVRQPTA